MAHEIDMSNERANMAYVGQKPWHDLGQELTRGAPLEIWCKEAGLDWEIKRAGVMFKNPKPDNGDLIQSFPERHVLYRGDSNLPLSIVSEDYKIVQPREVIEFYRDLVGAAGFELETAGSLFGGKRIWAMAKTGDEARIKGQDKLLGYLLLATSCDGSLATTGIFTSVRVVCNNTLTATGAYGRGKEGAVKVPHSREFRPEEVKAQLGLVHKAWAEFTGVVERLAERKVTQGEAQKWLVDTFGDPTKPVEEQDEAAARFMKKVWDCVRSAPGSGLASADGTAWGLVNGATYYYDHARNTRSSDSRFNRAQFGDGAAVKRLAMENALKLAA